MIKKTKWYMKILIFLLIVVFLPIIVFFVFVAMFVIFVEWLKTPLYKKQYYNSDYFKDLKIPYRRFILQLPSYIFYNAACDQQLDFELIHQDSSNYDYIIYKKAIYIFPMFDQMCYNDEKQQWELDYDGDWLPFRQEIDKQTALLKNEHLNFPIYLLVKESELATKERIGDSVDDIKYIDYEKELLPSCVKLGESYLSALLGK